MVDNCPNVSQATKQWYNWSKKQLRYSTVLLIPIMAVVLFYVTVTE